MKPPSKLYMTYNSLFTDLQDTLYPFDLHGQIQFIEFSTLTKKIGVAILNA